MSHHWTESADEIDSLAKRADAIEWSGCMISGGDVERCDNGESPDFFSVFLHFTPQWDRDPNALAGALCIADRDTMTDALAFADDLAKRYGLPIYDYT